MTTVTTDISALAAVLAEDAQRTYATPEARAALRCALADAANLCGALAKNIKIANPGWRRDNVSPPGLFAAWQVQQAAETIWKMRELIEVPSS